MRCPTDGHKRPPVPETRPHSAQSRRLRCWLSIALKICPPRVLRQAMAKSPCFDASANNQRLADQPTNRLRQVQLLLLRTTNEGLNLSSIIYQNAKNAGRVRIEGHLRSGAFIIFSPSATMHTVVVLDSDLKNSLIVGMRRSMVYGHCLNCAPTCSVAMLVLLKFMFLWQSTKE